MTQKEKNKLLLQDLCARLPYGVIMNTPNGDGHLCSINQTIFGNEYGINIKATERDYFNDREEVIKPYLRPMSSMTEKEKMEFIDATDGELRYSEVFDTIKPMHESEDYCASFVSYLKGIVWLNKKMFDYRALIPLGLAIEVTKANNPYDFVNIG